MREREGFKRTSLRRLSLKVGPWEYLNRAALNLQGCKSAMEVLHHVSGIEHMNILPSNPVHYSVQTDRMLWVSNRAVVANRENGIPGAATWG